MRNHKLDNLRCLAIMLVVLGHSIIIYDPSWGIVKTDVECTMLRHLKMLINVIQMPLFFALSGFLYPATVEKYNFKDIFRKKFKRLIIPGVVVLLLFSDPLKIMLGIPGYTDLIALTKSHLLLGGLAHLWFLPTLFGCFVLSYLPVKEDSIKVDFVVFALCLALNALASHLPSLFQVRNIAENMVYFYSGLMISRINYAIELRKVGKVICVMLILAALCLYYVSPDWMGALLTVLLICIIWIVVPSGANRVMTTISACSFGIYLFHSPLIYLTFTFFNNSNPLIVLFTNICWGGVILFMVKSIKQSQFKFIIGG